MAVNVAVDMHVVSELIVVYGAASLFILTVSELFASFHKLIQSNMKQNVQTMHF